MIKSVKKVIAGTICAVIATVGIGEGTMLASAKAAQENSVGQQAVYSVVLNDTGANKENTVVAAAQTTKAVSNNSTGPLIGVKNAKNAALSDAGLKFALFIKAKLDKEDNVYEIKFITGFKMYEYEIGAKSGRIVDKEVDTIFKFIQLKQTNKPSAYIGVDKAKEVALSDAGLNASSVTFTKTKLDKDDNEYEIEFVTSTKKYEYEINAGTGRIVSGETEAIKTNNNGTGNNQNNTVISVETAKSNALARAGLNASNVTFIKAKLERDDGRQIYDIDFISGIYEYEVEIDALSGKVIDFSRELNLFK